MSFTYDATQLATSALWRTRFNVGDCVQGAGVLPSGENVSDEEITFLLSVNGNESGRTAVTLLRLVAARWATVPQSFTADGLSVNRGDTVAKLTAMADRLDGDVGAGGITSHEIEALAYDDEETVYT